VSADPRHGDPVGIGQIAGLVVAFKALVHRAGGRVEISGGELEHARALHAKVSADPEVMVVELVDGPPPDVPRFEAGSEGEHAELGGELGWLRAWHSATVPLIAALAIYGEDVNLAALVAKASGLNVTVQLDVEHALAYDLIDEEP